MEICGPSGAGKTELLLEVAANCLLRGRGRAGRDGGQVLFVDLNGTFDPLRLVQVLDACIHAAGEAPRSKAEDEEEARALALQDALERFHLARCHDSVQLLALLRSMRQRMAAALEGEEAPFKLLCVDNIGAFYWLDRAFRGTPADAGGEAAGASYGLQSVFKAIVRELRCLAQEARLPLLVTKSPVKDPFKRKERDGGDRGAAEASLDHQEYLPASWQELVTHRLMLSQQDPGAAGGAAALHLARWQYPHEGPVVKFFFTDTVMQLAPQGAGGRAGS